MYNNSFNMFSNNKMEFSKTATIHTAKICMARETNELIFTPETA